MKEMNKQQSGFSYIDVMIAITILMIGVLGLVGAITNGINMTTRSATSLGAKQVSSSSMESIFTARDLAFRGFGWPAIGNVGDAAVPGAVFLAGPQPIYPTPGADGIIGTADDSWGADGISGTADDAAANTPVVGMQREILVRPVPDPDRPTAPITMRQIDVIITYYDQANSVTRREVFTSFIASYRDSDTDS